MEPKTEDFSSYVGTRMRAANKSLAHRWLTRLEEVLSVTRNDIFPTQALLDHIPYLFAEIGEDLRTFESDTHFTHSLIAEKARELGKLRFTQQASVHQLLREYAILAGVLEEFISNEISDLEIQPSLTEVLRSVHRIHHVVRSIMQTTVDSFVDQYTAKITDQHERLQSFNRMISHELRKPIQALLSNVELLTHTSHTDHTASDTYINNITREVHRLSNTLRNLEQITVVEEDEAPNLMLQEVYLESTVTDAFNQVENEANSREVDLRMGPLPGKLNIELSKLDLILRNLIDNGIKYSDPKKAEKYVKIYQLADDADNEYLTICVEDNGIGIPQEKISEIFKRYRRAHAEADQTLDITGYGIGLSVVKEELDRMDGRIQVESEVNKGTTFIIQLPKLISSGQILLPDSNEQQ